MKYLLAYMTLSLPFFAYSQEPRDPSAPRGLEIIDQNKKLFKEKEDERITVLFENKNLGIIQYEDHCKKESLQEAAIKSLAGLEPNCKKKYYLRLRLLCADPNAPNIVEIPFPKKNVTITAKNKENGEQVLSLIGVPENGYIQGSLESKKEFNSPQNILITVEYKDFKKTFSADGAKGSILIPVSTCLKKD